MARPFRFDIGDLVRSNYRARWVGVVVDREGRGDVTPLYTIRVVLDNRGNPVPKHVRSRVTRMDEAWLEAYTPQSPEEARLINVWSDPSSGWAVLDQMAVRVAQRHIARTSVQTREARIRKEEQGDRVYLFGDTFSIKDDLKRKGFRWDPDARGWWISRRQYETVRGWIEPALGHPGAIPTPLSHAHPSQFTPSSRGKATERQVEYALSLLRKLGPGWHDTDMGQGFGPPSRRELERMTSREISEFIDQLKSEWA